MKQAFQAIATVFALTVAGAGVGHAYWFGPTTVSHDGQARGAGKGYFYGVGWDGARLEPTLKDLHADGMLTYIEGKATRGSEMMVKVQSGRRGDGKDWWATLTTKTAYAGASTSTAYATTKVCMDRSWAFDPCQTSKAEWW